MRIRVSILNLLLVTTVIALAFGVFQLYAELRTEKALRRELLQKGGILEVSDPDAAHVVQVTTQYERNTRRWRVYVPPGRTVTLNARIDSLPAEKKPTPRLPPKAIVVSERAPANPIELDAGEHVVSFYFDNAQNRARIDAVGTGSRKSKSVGPFDGIMGWYGGGAGDITRVEHAPTTFNELVSAQTIKLNDGETFVLCRFREPQWAPVMRAELANSKRKRGDRVKPSDKVAEVLVWLQPDGG